MRGNERRGEEGLAEHLLQTLKPERWSQAFLASKISSYITKAAPEGEK